jgi:hypothetical protein
MNRKSKVIQSRVRRIGAWTSLLALLLIYAPMAEATLMAVTGACCTGDECPIHGHHGPAAKKATQASRDVPIDCGHEGGQSKMRSCSMSCCHPIEQAAGHAPVFLLIPLSISTALAPFSPASLAPVVTRISSLVAPPAPPPKSLAD